MNKGFTMIEAIISLMITTMTVLLLSMLLQIVVKNDYQVHNGVDEKNIHQMRLLFVLSKDYEINGDMLYFHYQDKDMRYQYENSKLILEEGYQVFFSELTKAFFTEEDACYYFHYERNSKVRKRVIGCE